MASRQLGLFPTTSSTTNTAVSEQSKSIRWTAKPSAQQSSLEYAQDHCCSFIVRICCVLDHAIHNENGAVNDSLHPQLAELLFSLCTTYAQENFYNAELSPSIETILVSQNRLIEGIAQLLEQSDILSIGSVQSDFALAETLLDDKNIQNRLNTISLILWTTSCILWRNLDTGATKFATIQLCSEHSPKMINHLISLSLSLMNTSQGKIDREENLLLTTCKRLKKAACWLLCVFVRVTPQIINQIFEFYAQNQIDNAHPQEPEFVPDVLYSLGQICQSTKAVSQL